ncbi:hypothetical protein L0F63_004029, partial [Massospora cicadina]
LRRGVEVLEEGAWAMIALDPILTSRTPAQIKVRWRTNAQQSNGAHITPWSTEKLEA